MSLIEIISTYGLAIVAALATVVSIITEVVKNVGPMKNVPTDLVVILLSAIVTVVAYFMATSYFAHAFVWYELVAAIIGSFVVAFVAMYGWDKINDLWTRNRK